MDYGFSIWSYLLISHFSLQLFWMIRGHWILPFPWFLVFIFPPEPGAALPKLAGLVSELLQAILPRSPVTDSKCYHERYFTIL